MGLFLAAGREFRPFSRPRGKLSAPRRRGFTLIELMVTVAIVAILAAVAYPAYTSHVRKGYRAAAQSYLMDLAQKQSQYLLDNRAYAGTETALGATAPADVSKHYTIGFEVIAGPPPTFKLTAQPKPGSTMENDGALTINQAGAKTPSDKW